MRRLLKNCFSRTKARPLRRWMRIVMCEPATLRIVKDRSEHLVILNNLSAGGARIRTSVPLSVGAKVELSLNLGLGLRYEPAAEVVNRTPDAGGFASLYSLKFINLVPSEVQTIAAYVMDQQHRRSSDIAFNRAAERDAQPTNRNASSFTKKW